MFACIGSAYDAAPSVAQMRLDRFLAQEQLGRDFRIGLAVGHELMIGGTGGPLAIGWIRVNT